MDAVDREGVVVRCLHVAVIKQLHRESAFDITAGYCLGLCVISGLLVCFCSLRVFLFLLCALNSLRYHAIMIVQSLKFKQQMFH